MYNIDGVRCDIKKYTSKNVNKLPITWNPSPLVCAVLTSNVGWDKFVVPKCV